MPLDLEFDRRRESFAEWREVLLGLWNAGLPPCQDIPEGELSEGRVRLRFATGATADGRLELPLGNPPFPAVLLLHDHGGTFELGWKKLFDLEESRHDLERHYAGQSPATAFLEAGFAVLCLDAIGWGARQAGGYDQQQALAANAMGLGWSLAGLVAGEDVQAAAWLAERPEIDAGRVGAFGFSFGGFRAWQVAALSPQIRAAASASWMARRVDLMRPGAPLLRGQSAYCFLHPNLAARADFPDLAGLAAGKAMFFRSGKGDPHMPEASVLRAWEKVDAICRAAGGPQPDTGLHDHAHTCPAETLAEAVEFLHSRLA